MTPGESARTKSRRAFRGTAIGLIIVIAAIVRTLIYPPASLELALGNVLRKGNVTLSEADGILPGGVTVFDDAYTGVANPDPGLLGALREAATHAADEGVTFYVNSGWRSSEYQNRLLHKAVAKYGSEAEAARWVATAKTSAHVSGDAVDIGHAEATLWLSEHGSAYGLCQIYRNEPWHYELRPQMTTQSCPPLYADPTHDPRMQQ